jgi:hypothetical protein
MRIFTLILAVIVVSGCATSKGNERAAQHGADQIRMVAVQKEAQRDVATKQAQADAALYEALARVAESNPDHAPSVAVALAVIGVSGGQSSDDSDDRIVTLQQQQNTALEWTKALAPTVGGLVTGLGVAAINADVAKTQSDNSARIQINDAIQDKNIVDAVAGLGTAAANSVGVSVAGDYITATDQAVIDQSTTTTTTSTTSSVSNSTEVSDSYNSQSSDTNLSQGDNGILNTGEYSDPYHYTETNLTNTVTTDTTVTYQGATQSIGELIQYLQGLGTPYSLSIGGEVVAASTSGSGETTTIDCSIPQFSPQHPDCV